MPAVRTCLTAGLLLTLLPGRPSVATEHRWFTLGHRVIGTIAEGRLTPRVAAAVYEILGGQRLADASTWADLVREARPHTRWWHFVNIPLPATTYDSVRDCSKGCIIAAIAAQRSILADPAAAPADRADALRYLVHFIGDLHQPLHTADNSDRGGTRRVVWLAGDSTDLHQVWDGQLLERSGFARSSAGSYLDALRREMDTLDLAVLAQGSVVDWAMEGHRLAQSQVYRLPRGGRIGDAYIQANRAAVDRAIIAAGVRLARVLNETLGAYQPRQANTAGALVAAAGGDHAAVPVYADAEAAAHVGETATVVGTVATVRRSRAGTMYLNFGADYPRQAFSGTILQPAADWTRGLDSLRGRRIGLRGRITVYQGRAQIVIERPEQLVIP